MMSTQQPLPLNWEYWEEPSPIFSLKHFPGLMNLQQQPQNSQSIHRRPLSRKNTISSIASRASSRSASRGRKSRSRNPSRSESVSTPSRTTRRIRMRHDHLPPLVIPRRKSSHKGFLLKQQISDQQRVPCPVYVPKPIKPLRLLRHTSPVRTARARKRTTVIKEDSPATTPYLKLSALPSPLRLELDIPSLQEPSPLALDPYIPAENEMKKAADLVLTDKAEIVSSPIDFAAPDHGKLALPSNNSPVTAPSNKKLKRSSAIYKSKLRHHYHYPLQRQKSLLQQRMESVASYTSSACTDRSSGETEMDWLPVMMLPEEEEEEEKIMKGVKEPDQNLVDEFEERRKEALRELLEFVDSVLGSPLDNSELMVRGLGETPKTGRGRREGTVWWRDVRRGLM
ncbi:hypothetical protein QBC35DRAFT_534214 [Podospora australis]|uniref:Uncharacterized protein n=1 Tax=Podospora australis TaxID=1536484 RepID=A0AAN7AGT9_9PEZI|nr:hypothetical protein QBC35DRAFT_534214 [Podospora australis]